jgi:hypothetical protein
MRWKYNSIFAINVCTFHAHVSRKICMTLQKRRRNHFPFHIFFLLGKGKALHFIWLFIQDESKQTCINYLQIHCAIYFTFCISHGMVDTVHLLMIAIVTVSFLESRTQGRAHAAAATRTLATLWII